MARAVASIIIEAPVEAVWAIVRDFSALPAWVPGIGPTTIEDGRAPDSVGCIRAFTIGDGTCVRERLLALDDSQYMFSYNFETPAFPVANYVSVFQAIPVTNGDRCFVRWEAEFDEAPDDAGKYVAIVTNAVFGNGLASLAKIAAGHAAPEGARRWQGRRPAKVFCSSVIGAPLSTVWATARDFAGMEGWHDGVRDMHMRDGARSDQVGAVRDFSINGGHLLERLTYMSDTAHAFRYTIDASPMPWLNYHSGAQFQAITSSGETFAIWTADWVAASEDDLALIPAVHDGTFQKAFDTLDTKLRR